MKTIILITGYAGSGKSTAAEYIEKEYNYKEFALGDYLKILTFKLLNLFGIPIDSEQDLYDPDKKAKYRRYLQQIGTECMRGTFGDDFWCEQIDNDIKNTQFAVISDVRFMNEYKYFASRYKNIYTIRIIRDGISVMNHQSEQEINNIHSDYVIYNNSDKETLYRALDIAMTVINDKI